ncbi:hypothetical protein CSKR_201944 [Clonorchis sinensis]|uniref:Uncharacterized protein n=1 Tax=Clonorchis sinensis TaxID=79923 RepID=A0A8T1MZN8_CLOSI|nr:hypothetical protein CSKR_201633 [Clonorchis sinensis]KAG5454221.1 hypothetical protein CSKR_201944 [Clonorchis sinensis]
MGLPVATPVRGSAYKLSRRPKSRGLGLASWHDFPTQLCVCVWGAGSMAFPQCAGRNHVWADCLDEGVAAESWLNCCYCCECARSVVGPLSLVEASVLAMHSMQICFAPVGA